LGVVKVANEGGSIGNPLDTDKAVFRIPEVFAGLVVLVDSAVETKVAVEIVRGRGGVVGRVRPAAREYWLRLLAL
jgi:hypothetical protein